MGLENVCLFGLLQYSENKSYCEDLTEGKFSFPIIHAIKSRPDDNQVIRILLCKIHSLTDADKILWSICCCVL
jgi:hypothetical protein